MSRTLHLVSYLTNQMGRGWLVCSSSKSQLCVRRSCRALLMSASHTMTFIENVSVLALFPPRPFLKVAVTWGLRPMFPTHLFRPYPQPFIRYLRAPFCLYHLLLGANVASALSECPVWGSCFWLKTLKRNLWRTLGFVYAQHSYAHHTKSHLQ